MSPACGSSPCKTRRLRTPWAAAPRRSPAMAMRLRSRQVVWRIGSKPLPARMAAAAKLDIVARAPGASVTLTASTRPRSGAAASSRASGEADSGGVTSAVITKVPASSFSSSVAMATVSCRKKWGLSPRRLQGSMKITRSGEDALLARVAAAAGAGVARRTVRRVVVGRQRVAVDGGVARQQVEVGRAVDDLARHHVDDAPGALPAAAHHHEPAADDGAPEALHERRPDHDVGDAELVLQGHEDDAAGAAGALAHQDQAGDDRR